jgi:hypothetical protein
MSNKRITKSSGRSAKSELLETSKPAARKRQPSVREMQEQMHRLEVEIAAAPRLARQKYLETLDVVPAPESLKKKRPSIGKAQLSYAQKLAKKRARNLQLAEFAISFTLIAGLVAWIVKWWQAVH